MASSFKESTLSMADSEAAFNDIYARAPSDQKVEYTRTQELLSIPLAAISLLATIIGVGVLTLPGSFAAIGWVSAIIFLLISALLQVMLYYCFSFIQMDIPDCESYSELINRVLGKVRKILEF